jgi:NADPH-dependent ferric siderophore reductase
VSRVARVGPRVARLTFEGGDLTGFVGAGPDQFVYVLLPPPGRAGLTIDAGFTWDHYRAMPPAERPVGAYYTVRYHRPATAEVDIDFVLHGGGGTTSRWAASASPGDPVALWGPRTLYHSHPAATWQLLVGDETGLPAIGAILESLPAGSGARVFVEVGDAGDEQPLRAAATVEVTWLHRDGVPAGESTLLLDAVRALTLPRGTVYAWGGGELRVMTELRRHLREERGLAAEAVSVTGYWRHRDHDEERTK